MRTKIKTTPLGLEVRAIAGTYVVLLAFNCDAAYRKGLLGFSIQRTDHTNGESIWLRGGKHFDLPSSDAGEDTSSRTDPFQKFHWGDYTTKAGRSYTYVIHAREGTPEVLSSREEIDVTVTCEDPEQVGSNGHQVHFNRSAAASQAYVARFGDKDPEAVGDEAFVWLSRGLQEALIAYVDAAQKGETLHLFVYEFEKDSFLDALKRAKKRGVKLQIIYDAVLHKQKDKKTGTVRQVGPSLKSIPQMKAFGFSAKSVSRGRTGVGLNISHNKFMVLAGKDGKAKRVWTGSTNWTDNGIYGQTNVGHAVVDPVLAQQYLDWHQTIWNTSNMSTTDARIAVLKLTSLPPRDQAGSFLMLSQRKTIEAVIECARLVASAGKIVCFTAPFAMHDDLETALVGTQAQVFGLLNKDGVVGPGLHKAPNTKLAAASALDKVTALEIWQKEGHKEAMHHSGVFIHTKIILVDPLSETPVVITGSANFSVNSSKNNDENQLFIVGEKEVADIYLGEFMRMFDHYYFRAHKKRVNKELEQGKRSGFLTPDNSWSDDFFGGGPKEAERTAFF